ncbi:hypothetical protein [Phaeovulum vinaykumarii]|uniref:Lipoprotein n=1 Tax=Phaeovulum vinaykumarii TaxID=407234 RepID=A0A1N7JWG6_9RHOB|nr:hypothetical protein [Phaeovulum vinaykumarii]SIS53544.1 hypothetical protein SAMN05421795_101389 [Phaeovulum vinaykumarii]SOB91627.1 hypothetical protein SAMN05878426_101387 [Phaeovulum vinaykumarii]
MKTTPLLALAALGVLAAGCAETGKYPLTGCDPNSQYPLSCAPMTPADPVVPDKPNAHLP